MMAHRDLVPGASAAGFPEEDLAALKRQYLGPATGLCGGEAGHPRQEGGEALQHVGAQSCH